VKNKLKLSVVAIAVSFSVANQAGAANTWAEARNDAMGGTGVASASYGSAALINPALLAKAKPEDDISVILPSFTAQINDKDDLRNEIEDINDKIDYYGDVVDGLSLGDVLADPIGTVNQFQSAAGDLADSLEFLKGKRASANAGAGIAVSIPNDTLSVAFVTKAQAHAFVTTSIDQQDIQYLREMDDPNDPGDFATASLRALDAAVRGSDQIKDNLNSTASGRAAIVSDFGVAFAHQFEAGGVPLMVGVTPKMQKTWLYNYTTSISDYNKNDWKKDRYRNDDTSFNIDVGLAADLTENFTVGLTGQNLISNNIDTKDVRVENRRTGEVKSYKDTYQISPLVTAGVAWQNELLTLSADGDLTETKGFKSEKNSQFVGVGAEVRPLNWLAVRAGYRADVKGDESNVFTGGVGFAPFNTVHVDLTGMVGERETWGAGAQLSLTF